MRVLWVSPHCWPDYVLREDGLGTKSQGGQTVVMYHCPRALAELDPGLTVDIYARMETGEPEIVELGERVNMIRCRCGDPGHLRPQGADSGSGPLQEFVDEVVAYAQRNGHAYDLIHGHYADGWYCGQPPRPEMELPLRAHDPFPGQTQTRERPGHERGHRG